MEIGLIFEKEKRKVAKNRNGISQIKYTGRLKVADLDTEEEITNLAGMSWLPADYILNCQDIFSEEYFEQIENNPERYYLLLLIECDTAFEAVYENS